MVNYKRVYTKKSYKLMLRIRLLTLILTSPLWIPLYLLVMLGYYAEELMTVTYNLLQKTLDKFIPQIK